MATPKQHVCVAGVQSGTRKALEAHTRMAHTRKGWFNETVPKAGIAHISFLRLDGDLYESTWSVLDALYDKVLPQGFVYIDDMYGFNGCREAVNQFRTQRRIFEPMHLVIEDDSHVEAAWWQKMRGLSARRHLRPPPGAAGATEEKCSSGIV